MADTSVLQPVEFTLSFDQDSSDDEDSSSSESLRPVSRSASLRRTNRRSADQGWGNDWGSDGSVDYGDVQRPVGTTSAPVYHQQGLHRRKHRRAPALGPPSPPQVQQFPPLPRHFSRLAPARGPPFSPQVQQFPPPPQFSPPAPFTGPPPFHGPGATPTPASRSLSVSSFSPSSQCYASMRIIPRFTQELTSLLFRAAILFIIFLVRLRRRATLSQPDAGLEGSIAHMPQTGINASLSHELRVTPEAQPPSSGLTTLPRTLAHSRRAWATMLSGTPLPRDYRDYGTPVFPTSPALRPPQVSVPRLPETPGGPDITGVRENTGLTVDLAGENAPVLTVDSDVSSLSLPDKANERVKHVVVDMVRQGCRTRARCLSFEPGTVAGTSTGALAVFTVEFHPCHARFLWAEIEMCVPVDATILFMAPEHLSLDESEAESQSTIHTQFTAGYGSYANISIGRDKETKKIIKDAVVVQGSGIDSRKARWTLRENQLKKGGLPHSIVIALVVGLQKGKELSVDGTIKTQFECKGMFNFRRKCSSAAVTWKFFDKVGKRPEELRVPDDVFLV